MIVRYDKSVDLALPQHASDGEKAQAATTIQAAWSDLAAKVIEEFRINGFKPEEVEGRTFYYGKGCDACNNTGYKGRQGLYEIMTLDDLMRDMIVQHASTQILRLEAKKRGMRTLRECGLMAIYDGVTSIEEVVRETIVDE